MWWAGPQALTARLVLRACNRGPPKRPSPGPPRPSQPVGWPPPPVPPRAGARGKPGRGDPSPGPAVRSAERPAEPLARGGRDAGQKSPRGPRLAESQPGASTRRPEEPARKGCGPPGRHMGDRGGPGQPPTREELLLQRSVLQGEASKRGAGSRELSLRPAAG